MNSKAQSGNFMFIFWFLFLLILVGGGIALGISMFFGSEYDFRQVDANILNHKLTKCLSENEIDLSQTNEEIGSEIYKKCKINPDLSDNSLLILIKIGDEQKFKAGPGDATQCALAEKNKNFPRCKSSSITKDYTLINITTGSNQNRQEKRT